MKILVLLFLPFSLLCANPAKKGVDATAQALANEFKQAAKKGVDATVQVLADEVKQAGFFISSDGDLFTLYHPIKDASTIMIEHQNHFYLATLRSHDHDIAHLEVPGSNFPFLEIENTLPSIGERGLIGGYICHRAYRYTYVRRTMVNGLQMHFILLDTPFNPSEIGGPLLNLNGNVIGINCSNKENLGLAIPLD